MEKENKNEFVLSAGADGALRVWPQKLCLRADATIQRFEPALLFSRRPRHVLPDGDGGGGGEGGEGEGEDEGGGEGCGGGGGEGEGEGEGAQRVQVETLFLGAAIAPSRGGRRARPRLAPAAIALEEDENASLLPADEEEGAPAGFWDALALLWPTRLAANSHELVFKAGNLQRKKN
ncbi:hypothetical protein T492DRAFT_890215 [Pavlovales sp. CCMP2436]|nr:hypothetical protein T492DRAFT_890215 [Pavlovales sp. CCMP2436]